MSAAPNRKRCAEDMEAGASTSSKDPWATTSFTWPIEGFSKLTSEPVRSDSFEAGICTWRLRMYPEGCDDGEGTHLSVFLEAQDAMWEPTAEFKVTVVNQADASKSRSHDTTRKFDDNAWGDDTIVTLPELRDAAAGWLINDTLVLTANITVQREDRFQLHAGVPCDVMLTLMCGAEMPAVGLFLQAASPFFRGALEDVHGGAPIPVDGSFGAWTFILSDLYPRRDAPTLKLGSVLIVLPVVHKYDFRWLLTRLVAFVKENSELLSHDQNCPDSYVLVWLALAERLQLDELRELCLDRLHGMTKEELQTAITVEVEVGSGDAKQMRRAVRQEVQGLGQAMCCEVLAIAATVPDSPDDDDDA
ncbi:hypothetical protein FOA52_002345 [Chlamydomonas sp. UWO 241]|nr:hypothetical protein FOA52_002345 [Chlamydomonas sp. UWO 241]